MATPQRGVKRSVAPPLRIVDELVALRLLEYHANEGDNILDGERKHGCRLRLDGNWEKHPVSGVETKTEQVEPKKGSKFDEVSGYGDEKPIRTLTNFALYDEAGRMVPVECLELESAGKIIAFGDLVMPRKNSLKHPVPPPAEKWKDAFAEAVLLQPPPAQFPVGAEEDDSSSKRALDIQEAKDILDKLLVSEVNVEALLKSGIGKIVNRLRRHEIFDIQSRAFAVKFAWVDILDRGGSDPACIDLAFLSESASKLGTFIATHDNFVDSFEGFHSGTFQLNALVENEDGFDTENNELISGDNDKKKTRSTVNSAEIVAEYVWNGTAIEPSGPHEQRLKQMIDYVKELLQCSDMELKGWRMAVHRRKKGNAFGQLDSYFFSPEGRRYRSRNEVGKAYEAGTFGQGRGRSARMPSINVLAKRIDPSSSAPINPLSTLPSVALHMPTLDDIDTIDISYARRPYYEFMASMPLKTLNSMVEREPEADESQIQQKTEVEKAIWISQERIRVRLELTGWAISSDFGSAGLYVHTDIAAYRLAGDLVVAKPASYYYPFFCSSFLAFEACRLAARALTDYSSVLPLSRLGLQEVMQDMLSRSRRCPGYPSDPLNRLIVPNTAVRYFYYPYKDRLTADFIASRYPLIYAIVSRHFEKTPNIVDACPFFTELNGEFEKRARFEEKHLAWVLQDEQRRRANEKRKALRIETKERERVQTLLKRLEQEGDLRPDDSLLIRNSPQEIASKSSTDPLMIQALEKFLSTSPVPAELRPALSLMEFDPALLDGVQLLSLLESGTKPLDDTIESPLVAKNDSTSVMLTDVEKSLMSGKLLEVPPLVVPETFGETFSRMLQIWEGARHFAQAKGKQPEEIVGSFPGLRRQIYESRIVPEVFVEMLKSIAQEDLERRNPPTASVDDLCYHLIADPAFDSAFDQTVWPAPVWLVHDSTWTCLLWSAMCDWLRHNPEMAALELLECGEVKTPASAEEMANEAGLALRDQAAPKDLDFLALCDDGLRALMLDPDAEEFCQPVDRSIFPDYDQVISRPMDLGTIRDRIAQGHYDPERAPPGAYVWDSEKFTVGKKVEPTKDQVDSDDDDDEDEKPAFNLLSLLSDYRSGSSVTERPDCGKCKNCLDKPRFGGYNTLRQPCKLKQQAEQLQSSMLSRDAKKVKTKDLWKRRQAALAKEEAMAKFDEMYFAHDCLGGGHEGLGADVRQVFRNCRVYNKGTTPIYRAASKLDAMFNAFYMRMVVSRDPKYAVPRVLGFPDAIMKDSKSFVNFPGDLEVESRAVVPRIRRGFPSIVATVEALAKAKDFSLVPLKYKLVALGWLVDRALDTVKTNYLNGMYSASRSNGETDENNTSTTPTIVEPLGQTRDFLRVWAVPHLIRETGGLLLFENMQSGQWSFLDELGAYEAFVLSLDTRGKREWNLKRNLEKYMSEIELSLKESNREFVHASQQLKTAVAERASAHQELDQLLSDMPKAEEEAARARKEYVAAAEQRHQEEEAARKKEIEEKRKLWAEAWTDEGKIYYYHVETRVTTWTKPKEMEMVYTPKPMAPVIQLTPQETKLNMIKQRIAELRAIVEECDSKVARARVEVGRDRAVFSWVRKLKLRKREKDIAPQTGLHYSIVCLLVNLLSLENYCLGEYEKLSTQNKFWLNDDEREQWISQVKAIAEIPLDPVDEAVDKVIDELRDAMKDLVEALLSRGPLVKADSLARQRVIYENWRWNRFLDRSRTLAEVGVALVHLRRFFLDNIPTSAVSKWEKDYKAKLLQN